MTSPRKNLFVDKADYGEPMIRHAARGGFSEFDQVRERRFAERSDWKGEARIRSRRGVYNHGEVYSGELNKKAVEKARQTVRSKILAAIKEHGPMSSSECKRHLNSHAGSVPNQMASMARKGMLQRRIETIRGRETFIYALPDE
jgi:hypothetical protein